MTAKATDSHVVFTVKTISSLIAKTGSEHRWYYDTKTPGLGLRVRNGRGAFYLYRSFKGSPFKYRLGGMELTVDQARKMAAKVNGEISQGINPHDRRHQELEGWQKFTIEQAIMAKQDRMTRNGRQPRSISEVRDNIERYCSDWLPMPICELRRKTCADRHALVTEKHGLYAANSLTQISQMTF